MKRQAIKYDVDRLQNSFQTIKNRIEADNDRIKKACLKYGNYSDSWLKNKNTKLQWNFSVNRNKKLGYCLNAKVSIKFIFFACH